MEAWRNVSIECRKCAHRLGASISPKRKQPFVGLKCENCGHAEAYKADKFRSEDNNPRPGCGLTRSSNAGSANSTSGQTLSESLGVKCVEGHVDKSRISVPQATDRE